MGIDKSIYANKLDVGKLNATIAISNRMAHDMSFFNFVTKIIDRFRIYDWGDLEFEDRVKNNVAILEENGRIVGAYYYDDGSLTYVVRD